MTDESLKVVGHRLLSLVVPHLEQVILTSSKHVATILGQICARNGAFVHSVKLTEVHALKRGKAVDSDTLIFRHNDHLSVVLGELEAADNAAYVYLVLKDDRV